MSADQAGRDESDGSRERGRPGRPRNASYDRAILDAAVDMLIEKGYSGLTIDGVAARTGVGRPTIYRRWPSKAALAIAVLDEANPLTTPPDTGSLREDLRAFQRDRLAQMNSPSYRPIMAGLVSDCVGDPALAEAFLGGFLRPRRAAVAQVLRRAVDRGELPPDLDTELVNDLLFGPLFMKLVMRGQRLEPELIDETIDVVIAAFGTQRTARPKRSPAQGRHRARR